MKTLILTNSFFGRVWLTQVLSQSGIRMYQIAVVWWIVQTQGALAGRWLAMFAIVSAIPPVVLSQWIGNKIDEGHPRKFMMISDFFSAASVFCAFLLFHFGAASVLGLAALGFVLSCSQSFFDPALNRSIRGLVGTSDLSRAIGYTASTASFANLFGAVISASLMGILGLEQIPLMTAVGYLISGIVLFFTPFREIREAEETANKDEDQQQRSATPSAARESLFRSLFLNTAVVNFFSVPVVILLPLVTDRVLKGTSSLLAGSFVGLNNARMMTFYHELFPEVKKGKLFATLNAYCNVAVPLGYALFGALADHVSLQWLIVFEGVGIAVTAIWLLKLRSR